MSLCRMKLVTSCLMMGNHTENFNQAFKKKAERKFTMYTISLILLAIAFAIAAFKLVLMVEGKTKFDLVSVLVVIGGLMLLFATNAPRLAEYYGTGTNTSYQEMFPESYDEGFKDGYNEAIFNAMLVESNADGYTLDFNGQEYNYTFEPTP